MRSDTFSGRQLAVYGVVAAATCAVLMALSLPRLPGLLENPIPVLVFAALALFATYFGIPFGGATISLAHMLVVAAMLVLGPVPAAWSALLAAALFDLTRGRKWPATRRLRYVMGVLSQNVSMQTLSVLAAGAVYQRLGGPPPLTGLEADEALPLLAALLTYVLANNGLFALFAWIRGWSPLQIYRQQGWRVVLIEASPLLFAPLVAAVYTQLGPPVFGLLAAMLGVIVIITYRLATALQDLERRARTLVTLNVVGQALSANLRLDALLRTVQGQVAGLMDARNLYVALRTPGADEISFPLSVENGKLVRYKSRRPGRGLTEYVMRTRRPLLLHGDVATKAGALEIEAVGSPAAAWLGVPLLAGDEALGVLAVQSAEDQAAYDEHDQETLTTMAAWVAIAMVNARLYEQTDLALAQRVRELSAVLAASHEGILLLDPSGRVLMANPALAGFWGAAPVDLLNLSVFDDSLADGRPLLDLLGYDREALKGVLAQAKSRPADHLSDTFEASPSQAFARTLTAVQTQGDSHFGWLMVLRDISDERQVARLQEDLTSMIIHDLRSPLTGIMAGAETLASLPAEDEDSARAVLEIIRASGQKMLELVNTLLDLRRLESGRMPVNLMHTAIERSAGEAVTRLGPLARRVGVLLEMDPPPKLPPVHADPEKLGRVLLNLVDNAVNHTPAGGRVRVWFREGKGTVTVGITDTGPGIPPDELPHIFDKFYQGRDGRRRRKGSGLGLAFCQLAVEAMGGQIWAESQLDHGTTFVLTLPISLADDGTAV